MVGGVGKFGPEGGRVKGNDGMMRGSEAEGMLTFYPGYGPFSSAGFTSNPCCVCRAPRFDLDRYGRVVMPNGVANSVRLVDNAGNLIVEFGKYGNFDSQYVDPKAENAKPVVATPEIPMCWPTGAGFTEKALYVCDTYNRRVVRADFTWQAEESCALGGGAGAVAPAPTPVSETPAAPAKSELSDRSEKAGASDIRKASARSADQVCAGWFSMARNYKNAGLKDEARRYLGRIVEEHPGSEWAARASEELRGL
jgi:hypothetical protein